MILQGRPVENILSRRQAVNEQLRREIAFGKRIDADLAHDIVEGIGGGDLDLDAGRPIGAPTPSLTSLRRRPIAGGASGGAGPRPG
jgi:hypothetical protein